MKKLSTLTIAAALAFGLIAGEKKNAKNALADDSPTVTLHKIDTLNKMAIFTVTRTEKYCSDLLSVDWNKLHDGESALMSAARLEEARLSKKEFAQTAKNSCLVKRIRNGDYERNNREIIYKAGITGTKEALKEAVELIDGLYPSN